MKRQTHTILVVDDDANDIDLIVGAFRANGVKDPIHAVFNGCEAIAYLDGKSPYDDRAKYGFPSTVITDLKMPKMSGFDVLQHIKNDPEWAVIPVIMLSASADTDDIKKAYLLGAATYFIKPQCHEELSCLLRRVYEYWKYAEVPEVNVEGHMLKTDGRGKLGENFPHRPGQI